MSEFVPPPRDVVPILRRPPDQRQALIDLNSVVGQKVATYTGPEVVCDADGVPLAVGEATWAHRVLAVAVTAEHLARVGLTPADVPNLRIINQEEQQ